MSTKTSYAKQAVELTIKSRSIGSNYRMLTRTVRVDDRGPFVLYRGNRVGVRKHNPDDGIDWVGTVQV